MEIIPPSRTLVRKAFARGYVMANMKESVESGIPLVAENFLMDAWYGLYYVLFHEDVSQFWYYPCKLASYIDLMCKDGIIRREDVLFCEDNRDHHDMSEIQLKSGIWRLQTDYLPPIDGESAKYGLIAYHRQYGNSVHGCIRLGPHFMEFLHQMDEWYDMILEELKHYCLTAMRLFVVEKIARSSFDGVLEQVFKDSGYEYKASYLNENSTEIRVQLESGHEVKFFLTLKELQRKADTMIEDIRSLEKVLSAYERKIVIPYISKKK